MSIVVMLIFAIIFIIILVTIIGEIRQWISDNNSPRLQVNARVISKRTKITSRSSNNINTNTITIYYVTFELESGDRAEFKVKGHEFGMLVEGDQGELTCQGSRYLGFKRNILK